MKDFIIGTMYWIDPKKSEAGLTADLQQIKANGISLVRIFICWEYVELRENEFDFTMFDRFFRAAETVGIGLMPTLVFYLPFFRVRQLLAKGIDDRVRRIPCLDRPEVREGVEKFFKKCVERYWRSPALKIWNLWNEPSDTLCDCPHSLKAFAGYLRERYPDIETLRDAWAGEYGIFCPVIPDSLDELDENYLKSMLECATRGRASGMQLERDEFQLKLSAEHLKFLVSLVRSIDRVHECHTNPCVGSENPAFMGIDPFVFGKIQESISGSVHPHAHCAGLQKSLAAHNEISMLSQIDLYRSWGGEKDAYIGEYQAGSTFFKPNTLTPAGKDIFATLMHSLARGLRGVIFWQWQAWRQGFFEVGEFSLRNPSDGGETERSKAVAEFSEFYHKHREFFDHAAMPQVRTAILISMEECAMDYHLDFDNRHTHLHSALLCHRALLKAGIAAEFVSESILNAETLAKYRLLVVPHTRLISGNVARVLRDFVSNGGSLWADGRCGFLDKYMCMRTRIPGNKLDELFGGYEIDEVAPRPDDRLTGESFGTVEPFRMIQRFKCAGDKVQVIADCNGYPAALHNFYGKGRAVLWGTELCAGDISRGSSQVDRILPAFAGECGITAPVEYQAQNCVVSLLENGGERLLVITNCSDNAADFVLPGAAEWKMWYGNADLVHETLHLAPGTTLCLKK